MNKCDLFEDKYFSGSEKEVSVVSSTSASSRQSLKAKFDREYALKENTEEHSSQLSRTGNGWCDALSLSMANVNAKQAWKNGTEKLSQTLNTVRTTFGTLSQRIKKSTKRRQPLINVESPRTPATPYTRSKALLGRTPTKLYSPFRIDTPSGKENFLSRCSISRNPSDTKLCKKKLKKIKSDSQVCTASIFPSPERHNDLLQTQIGIYEFQSVANRIVQSGLDN